MARNVPEHQRKAEEFVAGLAGRRRAGDSLAKKTEGDALRGVGRSKLQGPKTEKVEAELRKPARRSETEKNRNERRLADN